MIVTYNVCDNCGNQNRVMSGSSSCGIFISFDISDTYRALKNGSRYYKNFKGTFCDRECLVSYLTENLTKQGELKIEKKEGEND